MGLADKWPSRPKWMEALDPDGDFDNTPEGALELLARTIIWVGAKVEQMEEDNDGR